LESCVEFITSEVAADTCVSRSRFFIYPAEVESHSMKKHYPRGYVDCGMAHGLAGPIALIALALKRGVCARGSRAALEKLANWLARQGMPTVFGVNWPSAVDNCRNDELARAAWCYGNPGVARALWLAGCALEQDRLCRYAVEALLTVSRIRRTQWQVNSPAFCHGLAGLAHIALRFAKDTDDVDVISFAARLVEELVAYCEASAASDRRGRRDDWLDGTKGFLEGSAAVALTLLAAGSSIPPAWDRLFLLS
jgi:hypothetical protein